MYSIEDIKRIRNNFFPSIEKVIGVLLKQCISLEGCFAVVREVCCYIDFLGALYCGYEGKNRSRIATPNKAEEFIEEIFGEVDINYKKHSKLFYRMLRHGTVHCFRPHIIKSKDDRIIEWYLYSGRRKNCSGLYENKPLTVTHLEPMVWETNKKRYLFPLSTDCLYEDLKNATNIYFEKLEEEKKSNKINLLKNFESTMQALMQPEKIDLIW